MKKLVSLLSVCFWQLPWAAAQSAEVKIPSLSEEGLGNLLTSASLLTVIYIMAGLAGALALSYLICNFRMAYDEHETVDVYTSRHPSPADSPHGKVSSRASQYQLIPWFAPVDHAAPEAEEDPRMEEKGRGE